MLNRSRASAQTSSLEHSGTVFKILKRVWLDSSCGYIYLLRSFHLLICFVFDSVKQVS